MELNKCLGCMENYQGYPCPKCGYDPNKDAKMEYALQPETILAGKYMVGKVLGQGGFGITYIGWDIALERKVAIKEYYPSGQVSRSPGTLNLTWYSNEKSQTARQDGMQMFLKEARKMVKAENIPGVVRVLDLFQENGTAYIVMEFVQGITLKAYLQKNGPLTWEKVKQIFRPAIQAMAAVHQAGLIHRDLSPDNLMITPEGKTKILDLGAAKDLNLNSGASSMQVAKGGFSPLEQYVQRGSSGPWTDVYSMAATIYYALTGKLPPNAIDRLERDTISWDEPGLKVLPAPAKDALQKALAVQLKDRTHSMILLERGLFTAAPAQSQTSAADKKPQPEKKKSKQWSVTTILVTVVAIAIASSLGRIGGAAFAKAVDGITSSSASDTKKDSKPVSNNSEKQSSLPAADESKQSQDATYAAPAVPETEEDSGRIDYVDGNWDYVTLDSKNKDVPAIVFTQKLKRCKEMTVNIKIEMKRGAKCKSWQLWARIDGSWKKLDIISLPGGNGSTSHVVRFDTPTNLDAVSIRPTVNGGYSWSEGLWVTDVLTD